MKTRYISIILKIIILLIFAITITSNFTVMSYNITNKFGGDVSSVSSEGQTTIKEVLGTALDIVRYVGIGIALIILMYIGVKFMMAAPSERANIKQYSINYVIGAAILIGASGILTIIRDFSQKATTTT